MLNDENRGFLFMEGGCAVLRCAWCLVACCVLSIVAVCVLQYYDIFSCRSCMCVYLSCVSWLCSDTRDSKYSSERI